MSHCKNKPQPGMNHSDKNRERTREKRGYGIKILPDGWFDMYLPDREHLHVTYISAPFGDSLPQYAEKIACYARKAWENESLPVNPYLMYDMMFPGDDMETAWMIRMFSLMLLLRCDELWIVGRDKNDLCEHLKWEVDFAEAEGIPVRYVSFEEEENDE